MIECIGKAAMLEQLAEEAAELAQAALKCARIERGENPTPVTKREAKAHLIEEFTDVETCAKELKLSANRDIEVMKIRRFYDRLKEIDDDPDDDHIDEDIQAADMAAEDMPDNEEIPFC